MGGEAYTDPCYAVKMTHIFPVKQGMQATGQVGANVFRMPFKSRLLKIGVIPGVGSNIVCSSNTGFHLKTESGATVLATFVPGTLVATLSAGEATGCAPKTATTIPKGQVVQPGVAVVGGATACNVTHFMEYQRVYDSS